MKQSSGKEALLYVPPALLEGAPAPLLVMLHGAGGTARQAYDLTGRYADEFGFVLLAPASDALTWDVISQRRYGQDVLLIDTLLGTVFADIKVDPARVALAGFSDGASYALSLGLMNGDLFSHVIAFSPGFMAPLEVRGEPGIFISHGVDDPVLPIGPCSRRIAAQLRKQGRRFTYLEFPGGHIVPEPVANSFLREFVSAGASVNH